MAGFGTAPAGSTPFGFGTPVEANAPPELPEQSNFLNYRTRDYEVASSGGMKRMPTTRHRVLMVLSTVQGSAVHEPTVGLRLPRKIDRFFPQKVEQAVRDAFSLLGRDVRLDGVKTKTEGGRADIQVSYTDLTTGNSDTVTI